MRVTSWAALTITGLAGFSLAQEMPKCAVCLGASLLCEKRGQRTAD